MSQGDTNQGISVFFVLAKRHFFRLNFFSRRSGAILAKFGWFWHNFRLFSFILARSRRKVLVFCVSKTNFPLIFSHFPENSQKSPQYFLGDPIFSPKNTAREQNAAVSSRDAVLDGRIANRIENWALFTHRKNTAFVNVLWFFSFF